MTVGGIRIRIRPVTVVLMAATLLMGDAVNWLTAVLLLTLHEAAHVAAAKMLGIPIGEIEILPFGGRITAESMPEAGKEAVIALAGPLANAVAATAVIALGTWTRLSLTEAEYAVQMSLLIAAVNLLPSFPLDGGRILYGLTARKRGRRTAGRIVRNVSRVTSAGFAVATAVITGLGVKNATLWMMASFLLLQAWKYEDYPMFGAMRAYCTKDGKLRQGEAVRVHHVVMREGASDGDVLKALSAEEYNVVTFLNENDEAVSTVGERKIFQRILEKE